MEFPFDRFLWNLVLLSVVVVLLNVAMVLHQIALNWRHRNQNEEIARDRAKQLIPIEVDTHKLELQRNKAEVLKAELQCTVMQDQYSDHQAQRIASKTYKPQGGGDQSGSGTMQA